MGGTYIRCFTVIVYYALNKIDIRTPLACHTSKKTARTTSPSWCCEASSKLSYLLEFQWTKCSWNVKKANCKQNAKSKIKNFGQCHCHANVSWKKVVLDKSPHIQKRFRRGQTFTHFKWIFCAVVPVDFLWFILDLTQAHYHQLMTFF